MEISGINSSLPFAFTMPDKDDSGSTPAAVQDTVDIRAPQLLEDDEVDGVLDDTLNMIAQDNVGAVRTRGLRPESRVRCFSACRIPSPAIRVEQNSYSGGGFSPCLPVSVNLTPPQPKGYQIPSPRTRRRFGGASGIFYRSLQ